MAALTCLAPLDFPLRGDPPPPPNLASNVPPAMLQTYTNSLAAGGFLATRPQPPPPLFTAVTNASGRVVLATNDASLALRRPQPALSATIDITPDGAVSRGGGHQVWFDGNLNRSDSIVIQLPDNKGKKMLAGHVVGIRLADGQGKQSWLGLVRDCAGELVKDHPNWLIYRDAFPGRSIWPSVEWISRGWAPRASKPVLRNQRMCCLIVTCKRTTIIA